MICLCGHPNHAHEDNKAYYGRCNLCACILFEVKIVTLPRINKRPDELEMDANELPSPNWTYRRNNRPARSNRAPDLAQQE